MVYNTGFQVVKNLSSKYFIGLFKYYSLPSVIIDVVHVILLKLWDTEE